MGTTEKIARNLRELAHAARGGPAARRRLRRRYTFDALRRVVPAIGVDTADGFVFVSTADRTIGREVFISGGWEPEVLHRALTLSGVDLAMGTFVEVGANIGTTTLPAARLAERVVAIEPSPANVSLLRTNLAVNRIHNVSVVQAACSDSPGMGSLLLSATNWGDNRLVTQGAASGGVQVPLITLDDVLRDCDVDAPSFVWIDTQGHEPQVLTGATTTLKNQPPLLIEFWPPVLGAEGVGRVLDLTAHYEHCVDMTTGGAVVERSALGRLYASGATDLLFLSGSQTKPHE